MVRPARRSCTRSRVLLTSSTAAAYRPGTTPKTSASTEKRPVCRKQLPATATSPKKSSTQDSPHGVCDSGLGPAEYSQPASSEASPMSRITPPFHQVSSRPPANASTKHSLAARRTSATEASPLPTSRTGPSRSAPSAPRAPSPASLNRLVPAWMHSTQNAATRNDAGSKVPPRRTPSAVPSSTGTRDRPSVGGRTPSHQRRQPEGESVVFIVKRSSGSLCCPGPATAPAGWPECAPPAAPNRAARKNRHHAA